MHLHGADSPATPSASPVSIVHVGGSMIRCLAWCPHIPASAHEDGATTCFAVGAGQGHIALYDSAEPQTPVMDFSLGGTGARCHPERPSFGMDPQYIYILGTDFIEFPPFTESRSGLLLTLRSIITSAHAGMICICNCAGSTANAIVWMPGASCTVMAIGTQAGHIRRIPLAQAASLSLFSLLAKPLDGVCTLAYSHALKLVGYGTGAGLAALVACVARVNVKAVGSGVLHGKAKTVPSAAVCQVEYGRSETVEDGAGKWTLSAGIDADIIAPAESTAGTIPSIDSL